MKIDRAELSFGREASAALIVLNSPDVVVPARTTMAPEGGEVREAAKTTSQNARTQETAMMKKPFAMMGVKVTRGSGKASCTKRSGVLYGVQRRYRSQGTQVVSPTMQVIGKDDIVAHSGRWWSAGPLHLYGSLTSVVGSFIREH